MVFLGGVLVDGFRNVVFTVPESLPTNKIMKKRSLNLRKTTVTKDVKRQKQEQKLGS